MRRGAGPRKVSSQAALFHCSSEGKGDQGSFLVCPSVTKPRWDGTTEEPGPLSSVCSKEMLGAVRGCGSRSVSREEDWLAAPGRCGVRKTGGFYELSVTGVTRFYVVFAF